MSKCENCKKYEDCRTGCGLTWPCGAYRPQVVTRYDRFRSMSVEEMAKDRIRRDHDWCRWVCSDETTYREIGYGMPKEAIQHEVEWLNSPAKIAREETRNG